MMDKKDQDIKKALEQLQSPLSDPGFTDRIVSRHLAKADSKPSYIPVDLPSLLTGLLAVALSMLVTHLSTSLQLGISEDQLAVLQLLPVLYLVFQVMSEYVANRGRQGPKWSTVARSVLIGLTAGVMTAWALQTKVFDREAPDQTSEVAPAYGLTDRGEPFT